MKKISPLSELALDLAILDGWEEIRFDLYEKTFEYGVVRSADKKALILKYRKQAQEQLLRDKNE